MIITKEQLEDVFLHEGKGKGVTAEVWCLLYLATRNDGFIDAADAVHIVQSEPSAVSVLVERFLEASDVAAIQKISSEIVTQTTDEHCADAISRRMLDSWIAKTMMLNVVRKRQEDLNQTQD